MNDPVLRTYQFYLALLNALNAALNIAGERYWLAALWFGLACFNLFIDEMETRDRRKEQQDNATVHSVLLSLPKLEEEVSRCEQAAAPLRAPTA